MFTPGTDLVRKDSIEELCGHRNRAIDLWMQAVRTAKSAAATQAQAVARLTHTVTPPGFDKMMFIIEDTPKYAEQVRQTVDRDMWRALILGTPLGALMDREERDKFENGLKADVPEVTPENVFATMDRLRHQANVIFRRGLVNVFKNLPEHYRSHDGFKIGARIVLEGAVTNVGAGWGGQVNHYREATIQDIDRVFHVLAGMKPPEYQNGLVAALRTAMRDKDARTFETPLFTGRFFKNGNLHLFPKDQKLIDDANRLIAEHYGEVLGAGPDARKAA